MHEPLLQFFVTAHLPPYLAAVAQPFADVAHYVAQSLPRNPERSAALRKLLEAKDCAVRARLWRDPDAAAAAKQGQPG